MVKVCLQNITLEVLSYYGLLVGGAKRMAYHVAVTLTWTLIIVMPMPFG